MSRRGDLREQEIGEELRRMRVPGERESLDRALVLAAEEGSREAPCGRMPRRRLLGALAAAGAALLAALVLSPAGAAMRDWIGNAVGGSPPPATRTTIGRLPSGGSLLVQSAAGPWVVGEDGSRRLLGDYDSASWSPRGLFVAVSRGRTLSAVEPNGSPRWSIDAPAPVRDARWSTGGERIAYRSGASLRVVIGTGVDDRQLAPHVTPVAPSWMPVLEGPLSTNVLAYVDASGRVVTVDVDSGRQLLSVKPATAPIAIEWYKRDRILIVEREGLEIVRVDSGVTDWLPLPGRGRIEAATAADGSEFAVLRESSAGESPPRSTVSIVHSPDGGRGPIRSRTILSGPGRFGAPFFSPDDSRLLVSWRDADQWLFVAGGKRDPKTRAIGGISRTFEPGADPGAASFPRLEGWCCR